MSARRSLGGKLLALLTPFLLYANLSYAQDSLNVHLVNRLYENIGSAVAVEVRGDYAFLACYAGGLQVMDLSDEQSPSIAAGAPIHGECWDIAIGGDYAYVLTVNDDLHIFDITDPASPQEVSVFEIVGSWAQGFGLEYREPYIYLAAGYAGLWVVDVSDPLNPDLVSYLAVPNSIAWDVCVDGDYAYVAMADRGLYVFDISTPESTSVLDHISTSDYANGVEITGDYAFVADLDGGLTVVDISDPADLSLAGGYDEGETIYYVVADDSYAYASAGNDGLIIFDISDPASPVPVSTYENGSNRLDLSGDRLYLTRGSPGVDIVDVSDRTNPVLAGRYEDNGYPLDVAVSDTLACIIHGVKGLTVMDISDPEAPVEISALDVWGTGVLLQNNLAYIFGYGPGLRLVDLSVPAEPVLVLDYSETDWGIRDLAVNGDIVYLACGDDECFVVLDISDLNNPVERAVVDLENDVYSVSFYGDYLYVASGDRITVFEVRDPSDPIELGHYSSGGFFWKIAALDGYVYAADIADNYLRVVDVSDPQSPHQAGLAGGIDNGWDLEVAGDRVFAADGLNGLKVFDVSDPESPRLFGEYPSYGKSYGVSSSGETAYLADATSLLVLDAAGEADIPESRENTQPLGFAIRSFYPNPFNSKITIEYSLPVSAEVRVDVYDLLGRRVISLREGTRKAGTHKLIWNGCDQQGRAVASGTYLVRMESSGDLISRKVVLLR